MLRQLTARLGYDSPAETVQCAFDVLLTMIVTSDRGLKDFWASTPDGEDCEIVPIRFVEPAVPIAVDANMFDV